MVKRFLITTALEETWRDDEPVLFLGEWCKRYSRKDLWSKMDAEVLPYHWDDRAKLYADYQYLQELHERLLRDLTPQLNQMHGVDHSLRYWRILIGPWLGLFVQVLFDRWTSIQQAANQYDLSGTVVLTGLKKPLVPTDMNDFIEFVQEGKQWSHHIYATLLQHFTGVNCIEEPWPDMEGMQKDKLPPNWKQKIKNTFLLSYEWIANILTRDTDVFLIATYLPLRDEMRLCQRLWQVPHLRRMVPTIHSAVDESQRQWLVEGENRSGFESCVRALIPKQLPACYLEGYSKLVKQVTDLPWPKQPKLVWSSNCFIHYDVFKAWAAEKAEYGSQLVVGQHGGHYGTGRWSFNEDHEIAISDCFLSWGWTEPGQPKIKAVGALKAKRPLGVCHSDQEGILLVTCVLPQNSYWMYSVFVSSQYLNYFDDQCKFVSTLPSPIRSKLTVRLFPTDWGWDQFSRWRNRFPDLQLDEGHSKINKLIRQSRLYISTYNATTFLESFSMDVPTVIYWNPNHWELRDSAIPYFEELKRVCIFHETPESAARHVAAIWDNVDDWWTSPQVREVLQRFSAQYCHNSDGLIDRVEGALNDVMTDVIRSSPKLTAMDRVP